MNAETERLNAAERARRAEREPTGGGAFFAVVAVIGVTFALLGYLGGILGAALS